MRFSWMIFSAFVVASAPAWADEPTGDWLVADGNAMIRIENCSGALWGFVAWEKTPGGLDAQNPDPTKRDRPTLGLPVLLNMQPAEATPGRWDGEVYNAQNGKTYTAHIALTDPDTLRIEGCVLGFLCGGQNWTRGEPPADVPANPSATPPASKAAVPKAAAAAAPTPSKAAPTPAKTAAAPPKGAPAKGPTGSPAAHKMAAAKPEQKPEQPEESLCSTVTELPGGPH